MIDSANETTAGPGAVSYSQLLVVPGDAGA